MKKWCRIEHEHETHIGLVDGDHVEIYSGEIYQQPVPTGILIGTDQVKWLEPLHPHQFLGLLNNIKDKLELIGREPPEHPLYFVKLPGCITAPHSDIVRPRAYKGDIKFEAELGIVIGEYCYRPDPDMVAEYIFGYTCVNDVTAVDIRQADPYFGQWSRAKSFPTFGPIGPLVIQGIEPDDLRIEAWLDGEKKQDFGVSDMVFHPYEIVAKIASEIPLYPGDIISCGTSTGPVPMKHGQTIEVNIPGLARLSNRFMDRREEAGTGNYSILVN